MTKYKLASAIKALEDYQERGNRLARLIPFIKTDGPFACAICKFSGYVRIFLAGSQKLNDYIPVSLIFQVATGYEQY